MTSLLLLLFALPVVLRVGVDAPLTAEEAVRLARANSPKLKAARMEARAAQVQAGRDRPAASPTVTARVEGTIQGPRATIPGAGNEHATVLPERYGQVALTLEQLLWRPGRRAAADRYGAQMRASRWELARTENDLILDVRKAYYAAQMADGMVEVARSGAEMARKQLDLTRLMVKAGTASDRDVKASEADVAEAEQGRYAAESGVALARSNLNRLMGREPSSPVVVAPAPDLPSVPESPALGIEAALKRRPEILLLEENLRAARAGAILAGTQDKPGISARATALTQTPTALTRSEYFGASLILTWSPFDGGRTRSDVQEAKARAAQIEALLEDARLGVRLDVQNAWAEAQKARASIEAADRQIAATQAAADISVLRFEARSATQLEVAGTLFGVIKARGNRARAVGDLFTALADLAHATGADVELSQSR